MKSKPIDPSRGREIKLIHVARRELQLDEDTYRAMLQAVAGVSSSSDLDATGRKAVLDHMKRKGFKVKSKGDKPAAGKVDPQYTKIQALWSELHTRGAVRVNTEAARRVYMKRMTGRDAPSFCNNAELANVIEALKKWIKRLDAAPPAIIEEETPHG